MHIAIDIDGTITEAPEFFAFLTNLPGLEISIVSFRDDEPEARRLLESLGIRFDRLILINDPVDGNLGGAPWEQWKADAVAKLGAAVFFEDMPEVIRLVRPPTKAFMVCDEMLREWLGQAADRV